MMTVVTVVTMEVTEVIACAFFFVVVTVIISSADRLCVSCHPWELVVEMVEQVGSNLSLSNPLTLALGACFQCGQGSLGTSDGCPVLMGCSQDWQAQRLPPMPDHLSWSPSPQEGGR